MQTLKLHRLPATISLLGAITALITTAPAAPNNTVRVGDPAHPEQLRDAIVKACQAGARRVTITPGRYVLPGGTDWASLAFHNLKDVTLEANGVELAIENTSKDAVGFYGCQHVTLRGATVHYTVPHTGQGKILSIGKDDTGNYYEVQLDAGYSQDADFKSAYIMEGNSRRIKPGTWDMSAKSIKAGATAGQVRLYLNGNDGVPPKWNVAVGDYIVCRGPGAMMLHLEACEGCTLQDITLYWSGVFGYFDTGGGVANRFLHDTITYGPPPPGATNVPLLSQSADGLHCAGARVGPDIENCSFAGMPDDGIAIHGSYELVAQAQGTNLIVGTRGETQFKVGDPIRVQNDKSGFMADAQVTAVQPSNFTPPEKSHYRPFSDGTLHFFQLTLDHALDAPFDSLAADPARCGAGYRIIGNTIMNHRARGMLLKADAGLIQGNTIDGSSIAGIVIAPETWWGEAGYSRNIKIIGNTIRHTNYAMTGPWYEQAGALSITGAGSQGNQHIQILNNTFEDINAVNLMVRWAQDVTIQNNRFLNAHREINQVGAVGKDQGVDATSVIWLGDCRDVALTNNLVRGLGSHAGAIVTVTPTATGITGQTGGVHQ